MGWFLEGFFGRSVGEGLAQGNKKGPARDLALSATVRPPCDVSHVRRWRPGYNKDETHGVRLRLVRSRTIGEDGKGCQWGGGTIKKSILRSGVDDLLCEDI